MSTRNEKDLQMTADCHKYTVGEMSEMLDMPAATIRFYDASGAVTPRRDDDNRYRQYTVVDANYLLKMKELRNIDVQVTEAARIVNQSDLADFRRSYETIIADTQARIDRETKLLEGLRRQLARIEALEQDTGTVFLAIRPALWRYNNQIEDRFLPGPEHKAARRQWTDWMPLAHLSFRYRHEENPALEWGYLVEDECIHGTGLEELALSEFYPAVPCVRYVFVTKGQTFLTLNNLKPAIDFLQAHAFSQAGDIIGRSIARVFEPEFGIVHYYEVWIPVE